jgi:hypothetical protein
MYDQATSDLAGIPRETLQAWLLQAQTAFNELMTGKQLVQVQYSQGSGNRMVTYKPPDMAALKGYMQELKAALGINCGRSPITPYFRTPDLGGNRRGRF